VIRKAQSSDLNAVSRLSRIVQETHAANIPSLFKTSTDDSQFCSWFKDEIDAQKSLVIVAVEADTVIGYLYATEENTSESWVTRDYRSFHLQHIIVDPSFQNKGYGHELMQTFLEDASQRGIENVDLYVWDFNDKAERFFNRYGFKTMCRKLGTNVKIRSMI
jgi:diamine N-acetyltransferase